MMFIDLGKFVDKFHNSMHKLTISHVYSHIGYLPEVLSEELSLTLTPGQDNRQEQCSNCFTVVTTDHQCEEYIAPEVLSPKKDDF